MKNFPCNSCGACCKTVGFVRTFTEPLKPGTLECMHLDSASRCVIYRDRPAECHIRPGTYRANAAACNTLQLLTATPAAKRLNVLEIPEWA